MSQPISKEWTKITCRAEEEYKEGVRFFLKFAMHHAPTGVTTCPCPCKICNNSKRFTFKIVGKHLIVNGMNPMYDQWFLHGEKVGMNLIEHPTTTQVAVEEEKANPGVKIKRASAWKVGHTSQLTGEVLDSTKEKFKQIEDEEEKRKGNNTSEHGIATSRDDIEHDELSVVFGPEKKNWCRAISYSSSKKRVKYGQAAKAIVEKKRATQLAEFRAEMQATLKSIVKETFQECAAMYFGMQHSPHPQSSEGSTQRIEGASINSMQNQFRPHNLKNVFNTLETPVPPTKESMPSLTTGRKYVMLLSREQKEVAKGHVTNHTGVCHMRHVAPDERVVWVMEVKDPEALIYEAPQDGHSKLCEIADGGFLIWLESRLRYH